jgi:integrase/recombinase XerD
LAEITTDDALSFLNEITHNLKHGTKRTRYSHLSSFFNFVKNNVDQTAQNPCDTFMMKKLFRKKEQSHWDIIEKETVDEVIFRTTDARDRLILELMARGGMRVGEVLKLTARDVHDQKLILRYPKSGKEHESIFIPKKVAERLNEYLRVEGINQHERVFPISYETARMIVRRGGELVGLKLRPHDLRRHAATYASRSGVPIEIVSKVILRHANLSTTQCYLGKVDDKEAVKWIEKLYS